MADISALWERVATSYERIAAAEERKAAAAERSATAQEEILKLAAENSKHSNRVVKGVARAIERDEAKCPTCEKVGKCDAWCHTKRYP